jgi:translation initiation factor IF-2
MDDALNRNLALEIIDIVIDEKSEESEGFVIDRDEKAEWALRKIAEEKAEAQRYMNVCRSMISEYEEKIRKEEEKLKNKTSFLEGQLQRYFESVSHKVTK